MSSLQQTLAQKQNSINNTERLKTPSDGLTKALQHAVAVLSQHHLVTIPVKILPKAFNWMKTFKRLNPMRKYCF